MIETIDDRTPRDEAFEREALPCLASVRRYALSLTHDAADAEDLAQDTFLRAWRLWHSFVPGSDCRHWLFAICRNAFLRARERRAETVVVASLDERGDEMPVEAALARRRAAEASPDAGASFDVGEAIERALLRVPEPYRSALRLVDVDDQSYGTAAAVLRVPVGTVRSRLFRARRLMQEQLLAHARDLGLVSDAGGDGDAAPASDAA